MSFTIPKKPKNNRLLWLRIPIALLAIGAYLGVFVHSWHNAQAGLLLGDLTNLCLMVLGLPALLVETFVYRGYVDRYIGWLDQLEVVQKWRRWQPWTKKEDDNIVN